MVNKDLVSCKICGNTLNNKTHIFKELHLGTEEKFEYFQCSSCRCIQIKDFPEDISKYYPGKYYSFEFQPNIQSIGLLNFLRVKRDKYLLLRKGLMGMLLQIFFPNDEKKLNSLRNILMKLNLNILDIGCGSGELLFCMSRLGFKNLFGIDPYLRDIVPDIKGIKIQKKNLSDFCNENVLFDIIMLHHVFEHMEDPLGTLKICLKILHDSGTIVLRIPIADSYAWEHYQEHWVQLDAPRHYFIHTISSMEILTKEAGFKIKEIVFDSTEFQFWGSEQYKKNIPLVSELSYLVNQKKSPFSKKQIAQYKNHSNLLNKSQKGDQCIFYLQKERGYEIG